MPVVKTVVQYVDDRDFCSQVLITSQASVSIEINTEEDVSVAVAAACQALTAPHCAHESTLVLNDDIVSSGKASERIFLDADESFDDQFDGTLPKVSFHPRPDPFWRTAWCPVHMCARQTQSIH